MFLAFFMEFFFSKTDNFYKIIKTVEKIHTSKLVKFFIDPEHAIFENEWWWKQIREILSQKKINSVFVTKNKKNKEYYEAVWLVVDYQGQKSFKKLFSLVSAFLFNIKKFHLYSYETKKYFFVVLSVIELLFVLGVLWFVISLIIPRAELKIIPAEEMDTLIYNFRYYPHDDTTNIEEQRFLNIPYYTWTLDYQYDLSISTSNLKHIVNPSEWYIKIFNTTDQTYSLIASTRFITQEGVIFRATENFTIFSWTIGKPSETVIHVQADELDEKGQIIGIRWNIPQWTQLWIRNLWESYYFKEIRAETLDTFQWWWTESIGSITENDIDMLSGKLVNQVYQQKLNIVSQNFNQTWAIFLDFDSITKTSFHDIKVYQQIWENTPLLKWTALVTYTYTYVLKEDLLRAFRQYLQERSSDTVQISQLNEESFAFIKDSSLLDHGDLKMNGEIYIIPTQIQVFQGYDFEKDVNWILSTIKNTIVWMDIDEARTYILSTFSEVWNLTISVSPFWHSVIPTIKSRIQFSFE